MIDLNCIDGDDAGFILTTASIVTGVKETYQTEFIRLIRIDNWFGEKWRSFSGKIMGAFGISKRRLTIPPFVHSRVNKESCWAKSEGDKYNCIKQFYKLHQSFSGEENTRRYFDQCCPDTTAIWFSGSSLDNGRGSIMVYTFLPELEPYSWYVELVKKDNNWIPSVYRGITGNEFVSLTR